MQQIRDTRIRKIGVRIDECGNRANGGILRPHEDRRGPGGFHLAPIPRIRQKAQSAGVRMRQRCDARDTQARLALEPEAETYRQFP